MVLTNKLALDKSAFRVAFTFYERTLQALNELPDRSPAALSAFWDATNERLLAAGRDAPLLAQVLLCALHEYFEDCVKEEAQ